MIKIKNIRIFAGILTIVILLLTLIQPPIATTAFSFVVSIKDAYSNNGSFTNNSAQQVDSLAGTLSIHDDGNEIGDRKSNLVQVAFNQAPALRPQNSPKQPRLLLKPDYQHLKNGLNALEKGQTDKVKEAIASIKDPTAKSLLEWRYTTDVDLYASLDEMLAFRKDHPDWPGKKRLQRRIDTRIYKSGRKDKKILELFKNNPPQSTLGKIAFARALQENGEKTKARDLIQDVWKHEQLRPKTTENLLDEFPQFISSKMRINRVQWLLFKDFTKAASHLSGKIKEKVSPLIKMRRLVINRNKKAKSAFNSLPRNIKYSPVAIFSRAQFYRRNKDTKRASNLLINSKTAASNPINPDEWWEERRILIRQNLKEKHYNRAYKLAAANDGLEDWQYRAANFIAGWIALRKLDKPLDALKHFTNFRNNSVRSDSFATAHYWMAQAGKATKNDVIEEINLKAAAKGPTSFYGQLAQHELGKKELVFPDLPSIDNYDSFESYQRASEKCAAILSEVGSYKTLGSLLLAFAEDKNRPAELKHIFDIAKKHDLPHIADLIGRKGERKGVYLHQQAFPRSGLPVVAKKSRVEPAVVYGLSRQESGFNVEIVSHAGARGLMQIMPATAKAVARQHGHSYSKSRLTRDPEYNVKLGTAYLADLIEEFDGSYILAFAAYNAGPSRVYRWLKTYGDPRKGHIDPVDWIELIPFSETRNYVKRVVANTQVYRSLLNSDDQNLKIWQDITRN